MQLKKSLFIINTIIKGFSSKSVMIFYAVLIIFACLCFPGFTQVSPNSDMQLKQELSIIKQELIKRGEINPQIQNTDSLTQKISELSNKLQSAQDTIKKLEKELESKNNAQEGFININNKRTASKETELENEMQILHEKLIQCRKENQDGIKVFNSCNPLKTDECKKQLDLSSSTIIEQTKQLSKAYEEIEKLKNNSLSTDKIIDDIILQSEKLYIQGKTQEAITVYEILDKLDVKKPKIYQNLALIYQSLGMTSEADKQYNKLYLLFPNLKGDAKINKERK